MITNNHNNTLKENVETGMTFHVNVCPQLFMRSFDPYMAVGDRLVIRYYVTDWQDREYNNDEIAPTFTTVIRIDEDTVDQADVVEIRQTTYAGEQVLDLGTFAEGVHSFSIRTIQSNGVGSGTQYFRFLVEPADAWDTVLDLDETLHFTASMDRTRFEPHLSDPYYNNSNNLVQDNVMYTWRCRTVADYDVTVVRQNGVVKDIVIVVDGQITHENMNPNSQRAWAAEDISGTYHVTTECLVNGVTKPLADYIDTYDADNPHPDAVVRAATKNKLALNRLFEAAVAYGGKCVLRMPEDMVIVTEYYKWEGAIGSGSIVSGTCGSPIVFPDEFTLDMNGGIICSLINPNITKSAAVVVSLSNNFNTHIMNGAIRGCYTNFPLDTGGSTYEYFGVFGMGGCMFCSLRHVDLSGSCGYDVNITKGDMYRIGPNSPGTAPHMNYGYIDFDGVVHTPSEEELQYLDAHSESLCMMYSDMRDSISLYAGVLKGYTNYFYRVDGAGGANRHREVGREMFVHYYDADKKFIKTEKILQNYPIITPKDAVYLRTSLKGCNKYGTVNSLIQAVPTNNVEKLGNVVFQCGAFDWCCGLYGCTVHDERSCLFDGDYCTQLMVEGCVFWNIGAERDGRYGGYSVTKRFADLEDSTEYIFNMFMDNCELVFGDSGSFTVHRANNVCLVQCRSIAPFFQKDVYGGQFDMSYGGLIKYNGYGTPVPHTTVMNSILRGLKNERYAFDHGAATGDIWLKYCTLFDKSGGAKNQIYGIHCSIPNT